MDGKSPPQAPQPHLYPTISLYLLEPLLNHLWNVQVASFRVSCSYACVRTKKPSKSPGLIGLFRPRMGLKDNQIRNHNYYNTNLEPCQYGFFLCILGRGLGLPYPRLQWVWQRYHSPFHPGGYNTDILHLTGQHIRWTLNRAVHGTFGTTSRQMPTTSWDWKYFH